MKVPCPPKLRRYSLHASGGYFDAGIGNPCETDEQPVNDLGRRVGWSEVAGGNGAGR